MKLGYKVLSVVLTGATVLGIYQSVNSKTELGKDSFLIKDQEIAGLMDDQEVINDESACISEVSDGNDLASYQMSDTTTTDMTEDMASEPTTTDMTEDMASEPTTTDMTEDMASEPTTTDMTEDMASEPTTTDMTEDMIAESGVSKNTTVKQGC